MAEYVEVVGVDEMLAKLNRLQTSHPDMDKQLKMIIREVLKQATKHTRESIKGGDAASRRHMYEAVKSTVYKRIFGGNISILNNRKRSAYKAQVPSAPDRGKAWGGNRRPRSERTQRVMSYWGKDRAFILRFINQGTKPRFIKTSRGGGDRESIAPRNFFSSASLQALQKDSMQMAQWIEDAIQKYWAT